MKIEIDEDLRYEFKFTELRTNINLFKVIIKVIILVLNIVVSLSSINDNKIYLHLNSIIVLQMYDRFSIYDFLICMSFTLSYVIHISNIITCCH